MRIRYSTRALRDISAISSYIAKDNPGAAERVKEAISATVKLVSLRPYIGIQNARAPELRSRLVSRYPYRIHYYPSGSEIVILHVRHTARRPLSQSP